MRGINAFDAIPRNFIDMEVNLTQWIGQQRQRLATQGVVGYARGEPAAAEPVAIAALAACSHRLKDPAHRAVRCLLDAQNRDGSVSVHLNEDGPYWTTSLACIAWSQFERAWPATFKTHFRDACRRGLDYLTQCGGEKINRSELFGHNTQLVGWPWVLGTHSWLEPTSLALMAMRQGGLGTHPRAIEAARLLVDRQLPRGGANFGNTTVLGRQTRPHVLPSAMCVVAFHRVEPLPEPITRSAGYLRGELNRPLGAASLAWLIHALVASEGDSTKDFESELAQPLCRAISRMQMTEPSAHRENLLLLAVRMRESLLLDIPPMSLGGIKEATVG